MKLRLLAIDRFVRILPASALRSPNGSPEFRALPVELPSARRPNGIVILRNRALNPAEQRFIDGPREFGKGSL
jgi:hypothetical protein